jgi:hypothetical protein
MTRLLRRREPVAVTCVTFIMHLAGKGTGISAGGISKLFPVVPSPAEEV